MNSSAIENQQTHLRLKGNPWLWKTKHDYQNSQLRSMNNLMSKFKVMNRKSITIKLRSYKEHLIIKILGKS